ncbi:hypothetical protein [Pseudomonas aeruginosa]|uniref:hypothetical protein n=1 Tax=Pseudomonas aeruginosa TaxID=287 RepID=UPI00177D81F5|nr:hypothetical protein [Pseudomonas aeruginosa]
MTLLDIEKLLDMTHHMSVHIPIELIISWEQSEEAWSVKDNCLNFVYVNRRYTELITPRFGQKNSLLSPLQCQHRRARQAGHPDRQAHRGPGAAQAGRPSGALLPVLRAHAAV